jgi:serine/threonine protein phosphatase PrpC
MTTRLLAGGETHRGHVRDSNQDVILVEPELGLYAVLDGMGGANAGDVAARLAAAKIVEGVRQPRNRPCLPRQVLELALHSAAVEVFRAANERPEYQGMGTTVVACLVAAPTRVVIAHAGDSRAYMLRDGQLEAMTRDHTVAQRLIEAGTLRLDDRESSPHRHVLTRNLGRDHGVLADVVEHALKPGDRLLLCSDGLYGGVPEGAIRRALGSSDPPERIAHNLVTLALHGEALDNVSAVVIAAEGDRARPAAHRRSSRAQARRSRASGPQRARR